MTPVLSVVSPVYKAERIVDELVLRISQSVSCLTENFEILLVEDGSPDASREKIAENAARDRRVKGIKLSRNFGQHKLATSFTRIFNWLAEGISTRTDVGTYSLLTRKAVDAYCRVRDAQRHYLMIVRWLGFRPAYVTIEHEPRFEGRSSYTLGALIAHAMDGIVSQSDRLLRLAIGAGFAFFIASVAFAFYLVALYFRHGSKEGWTSTIVVMLLSTGMILMAIGVMGIYVARIFDQVKGRPLYLEDRRLNFDRDPPPAST
jgi:dolichol-phosphate mannosyltransferase